jgi:acyl-CoA thioesterase-1
MHIAIRFLLLLAMLPLSLFADVAAKPVTVIVFGDSITAGSALPANERDKMWVQVAERESKGRLRMVNEGKGGRPTDSVKEFEAMVARQPQAAVLVIALGTNDSRDITAACVPKAVANVRAMIAKARQQYGAKLRILLAGPPNINKAALVATKPIANEREAKLRELGDAFAALAKETGCEFVSLFGAVPESSMTKDGVHPDAAGNAAIARVMLAKLAP